MIVTASTVTCKVFMLSPSGWTCSVCGARATRICHAPSSYLHLPEPCVIDLCHPVCGSAACSGTQERRNVEMMRAVMAGSGIGGRMVQEPSSRGRQFHFESPERGPPAVPPSASAIAERGMVKCSACEEFKARSRFSTKQLKSKAEDARCEACVSAKRW